MGERTLKFDDITVGVSGDVIRLQTWDDKLHSHVELTIKSKDWEVIVSVVEELLKARNDL